jgi:precorrin-6B methylase 2
MISQPYIVAVMIEALELGSDDRVLEVGSGSGSSAVWPLGGTGTAPSLGEGHPFATVDR